MYEWENIISFESLYKAHMRARLSKRHKKEVIRFEMNLSENLWKLHYDLKYGRYKVGGYHMFMIYDPKEREIQAISYRDRIVQHSICDNFLIPLLERRLIYDNAACRKGKGSGFAISRLKSFMARHYKKYASNGYFVKIDVSKYFNNIDHSILKEKLNRIITDKRILSLLNKIIDSYSHHEGAGLPMGNQTSQCFALLYLDGLDRFFKEKLQAKNYVRYMDDIIILTDKKSFAAECLKGAANFLETLNLNINRKSQIVAAKNGVEFLGWRFSFSESGKILKRLRKSTKRRILAKISGQKPRDVTESLTSYRGLFLRSDSYYFYVRVCDELFAVA